MALDLLNTKGVPVERQAFTARDLIPQPYSKLNDDAFTRVRVILMNGIEQGLNRFLHNAARHSLELRPHLAMIRRIDQHQQTLINNLNPADQNALELTLGYEQVAIEVTASIAIHEPDPYLAQVHRFGMLEDFDHLYRYGAAYDRVLGQDPNNITQCYTDIRPGRPTAVEHRHPLDDLRNPYDKRTAHPLSKLHALTLTHSEHQTRDYYMNIGPTFTDPMVRALYAEIASIEEQHVTQYESLLDPTESLMEKWLMHEAMEVYNYASCVEYESNPRIKAIWERFLDYELGQLQFVMELFKHVEKRDPAEVLPATLPELIGFKEHREFVRKVLSEEEDMRTNGPDFIRASQLPDDHRSVIYQKHFVSQGSPTDIVSAGYRWTPGTELTLEAASPGAMQQPGATTAELAEGSKNYVAHNGGVR